jgi:hypothetical protein
MEWTGIGSRIVAVSGLLRGAPSDVSSFYRRRWNAGQAHGLLAMMRADGVRAVWVQRAITELQERRQRTGSPEEQQQATAILLQMGPALAGAETLEVSARSLTAPLLRRGRPRIATIRRKTARDECCAKGSRSTTPSWPPGVPRSKRQRALRTACGSAIENACSGNCANRQQWKKPDGWRRRTRLIAFNCLAPHEPRHVRKGMLTERPSIGARYSRHAGARLSEKLMQRVQAVAQAHDLRVSELIRAAIVEKLARIEAGAATKEVP